MNKFFKRKVKNRKLKENKRVKSAFETNTGVISVKAVDSIQYSGLINRFIKPNDIESNRDLITTIIPHVILIELPKYYYLELIELMEYMKNISLITLECSEDHMTLILSGSARHYRHLINNVPNQMINKLYRYIFESLYILSDDMMKDLINFRIIEDRFRMPLVYEIPNKINDLYVLYDTCKNTAYNQICEKYKISDTKKLLSISHMAIGFTDDDKIKNISPIIQAGLSKIMIDEPKTKNNIYMIVAGTYLQWVMFLSLTNSLYKNIEEYIVEKMGIPFNELLMTIIEPRSIHQKYIYDSTFDPNIDEIIEDIIEEDNSGGDNNGP